MEVVRKLELKNVKKEYLPKILDTIYKCFSDYAIDRRGDVGSWVRE